MMLKEYEIKFKGKQNGYVSIYTINVIAISPSHALDLFDLYAKDIERVDEIYEIKFIKSINACLIEKVGE